MSIKHFEDLPLHDLLHFLSNIDQYSATEKMDGSQLLFGFDDLGFYTSRETKGGKRVYDLTEYEIDFHTTYRRLAHSALRKCVDLLILAGMKIGDQVEVEILYGELPNVVEYSSSVNHIIFLRTVTGNVDIDLLREVFDGHSVEIELSVPTTENGIDIESDKQKSTWNFVRVPEWDLDRDSLKPLLLDRLEYYKEFLSRTVPDMGISYSELLSIHLGRLSKYNLDKESISKLRDTVRFYDINHRLAIKEILLKNIVRSRPSKLGPDVGFIEGVVFTAPDGKMFKLVDKHLFREVQQFYWQVRNNKEIDTVSSISEFDAILDKYIKARPEYKLVLPDISRVFVYTDPVHKRTLEFFASKRRRLYENR